MKYPSPEQGLLISFYLLLTESYEVEVLQRTQQQI